MPISPGVIAQLRISSSMALFAENQSEAPNNWAKSMTMRGQPPGRDDPATAKINWKYVIRLFKERAPTLFFQRLQIPTCSQRTQMAICTALYCAFK
jgi:hypothetical protein